MPDIVESCRWDMRYTRGHVPVTLAKAADEIERLRAALARVREESYRGGLSAGLDAAARAADETAKFLSNSVDRNTAAAIAKKIRALREEYKE